MADGEGCLCAARSVDECCCDVDWTPQETIDLRAENKKLKRTIELQKEYIDLQEKMLHRLADYIRKHIN